MDAPRPFFPGHGLARGETISSMMDRAGAIYGIDGVVFGRMFLHRAAAMSRISVPTVADWDDPPQIVKRILAECLKTSVSALEKHVIHDGPRWLAPGSRSAWCPQCFAHDLYFRNGTPYFRREWALIARTFCYEHSIPQPLLSWPDPKPDKRYFDGGRHLPLEVVTDRILSLSAREYLTRRKAHVQNYRSEISHFTRDRERRDLIEYVQEWEEDFDSDLEFLGALLNDEPLDKKRTRYYTRAELDSFKQTMTLPGWEINRLGDLLSSLSFQSGRLYHTNTRGWEWDNLTWPPVKSTIRKQLDNLKTNEFAVFEQLKHLRAPSDRRALFWLAACTRSTGRNYPCLLDLCEHRPIFVPYVISHLDQQKMT